MHPRQGKASKVGLGTRPVNESGHPQPCALQKSPFATQRAYAYWIFIRDVKSKRGAECELSNLQWPH